MRLVILFAAQIIQIMCRVVTVSTLRELRMHAGGMWRAMTVAALRHGFVFVGVAFYTAHIPVFGLCCQQLIVCCFVTGRT